MQTEHLRQTLSPPGSTLYYALKGLPDEQIDAYLALFALHRELRELAFSRSDTVYLRYGWWYEELQRALAGAPRHPVTQVLAGWAGFERAAPLDWLDAVQPLLGTSRFSDEDALIGFCTALGEPLFRAGALLLGDTQAEANAPRTGVAYTLFGLLSDAGARLRAGILPVPLSEIGDAPGDPEGWLTGEPTASMGIAIERQCDRVARALSEAIAAPRAARLAGADAPGIICAINLATLDEIRRAGLDAIHQRIEITPLRKAWLAWRAARKSVKQGHA